MIIVVLRHKQQDEESCSEDRSAQQGGKHQENMCTLNEVVHPTSMEGSIRAHTHEKYNIVMSPSAKMTTVVTMVAKVTT